MLLLIAHLLSGVNLKHDPMKAFPAGLRSLVKAAHPFGEDPSFDADPNTRVLACAGQYTFHQRPASLQYEIETVKVQVKAAATGRPKMVDVSRLAYRGETGVSAKTLLVTLSPETKERKSDRVSFELLALLGDGPLPVPKINR